MYLCIILYCLLSRSYYINSFINTKREIFHGRRWRDGTLYQAPMVDIGGTQVFVGDFITVSPFPVPSVAEAVGKIVRLYTKVRTYLRCIIEHS